MTDLTFFEPEHYVSTFLWSLSNVLRVNDHGLAPGHDLADLEAVARLCVGVRMIASAGRTVDDVLLASVAAETERLLTTAVIPAEGDVVKDWLKARAELLSNRLTSM